MVNTWYSGGHLSPPESELRCFVFSNVVSHSCEVKFAAVAIVSIIVAADMNKAMLVYIRHSYCLAFNLTMGIVKYESNVFLRLNPCAILLCHDISVIRVIRIFRID